MAIRTWTTHDGVFEFSVQRCGKDGTALDMCSRDADEQDIECRLACRRADIDEIIAILTEARELVSA